MSHYSPAEESGGSSEEGDSEGDEGVKDSNPQARLKHPRG